MTDQGRNATRTLLTGGLVIDGTGAAPAAADVLLEVDRIVAVGPGAAEQAGPDAVVHDVTGADRDAGPHRCPLPHHLRRAGLERRAVLPPAAVDVGAAGGLQRAASSCAAGSPASSTPTASTTSGPALRDAIEAGLVEGPRMRAGMNALLTSAGGTAGRLIPDDGSLGYAHVVGDRDEMVRVTREQIKHGADWIKIHVTGLAARARPASARCGATTSCGPSSTPPTPSTRRSWPTAARAGSTTQAAGPGVDLILHASFMDEEALEAVVDVGRRAVPHLHVPRQPVRPRPPRGRGVDPGRPVPGRDRGHRRDGAPRATTPACTVLCGSESGFSLTPYGHWHARELELLVKELGLDPARGHHLRHRQRRHRPAEPMGRGRA